MRDERIHHKFERSINLHNMHYAKMRKGGGKADPRPLDMDRILPAPASTPQRYGDRSLMEPKNLKRMEGLIWRQEAEQRLQATRARNEARKTGFRGMVTVLRMPLCDWHAERFGSRAG